MEGEQGEFVEKADNIPQAVKLIRDFWKKGNERLPIIAQELIKSLSYRVTVIDGEVVQTALKDGHGWKATSMYAKKVEKFEISRKLESLVKKITKVCRINICGMDFLKKGDDWFIIDINAEPSFEFFEDEREKIIEKVVDFLKRSA